MAEQITYEHPLTEKIRTLLRLEHLFQQIEVHLPQPHPSSSRVAVAGILDVVSIVGRTDLRSELLKELERQLGTLARLRRSPGVDLERLDHIVHQLTATREILHGHTGHLAQSLRRNDFLKTVHQRSPIPGGSCAFDLPQYHYWLERPHDRRLTDLQEWMRELDPLAQAVELLLQIVRGSGHSVQRTALEGFFQMSLDAQAPVHLVRVAVPSDLELFAEISGGKHRFSVRFMQPQGWERASPTDRDVPFNLTCCII
ncbi:MAG: cell division protein ZapD [Chromatiales bacterium]